MTQIKASYSNDLKVEIVHENGSKITTLAPKQLGEKEPFFSPTDLLAASYVSCILTLIGMEAKKWGVSLEDLKGEVEKEMSPNSPRRVGKLIVRIQCSQSFSLEIREKLEKAALECPVHQSLHPEIRKEFDFVWGI